MAAPKETAPFENIHYYSNELAYNNLPADVFDALLSLDGSCVKVWLATFRASYFHEQGMTTEPVKNIAIRVKLSSGTVERAIKTLTKEGWLKKQNNTGDNGAKLANTYGVVIPLWLDAQMRDRVAQGGRKKAMQDVGTQLVPDAMKPTTALRQEEPEAVTRVAEEDIEKARRELESAKAKYNRSRSLEDQAKILPCRQKLKSLEDAKPIHSPSPNAEVPIPNNCGTNINNIINKIEINNCNTSKTPKRKYKNKQTGPYYEKPYPQRTPIANKLPESIDNRLRSEIARMAHQGKVRGIVEQTTDEIRWAALRHFSNQGDLRAEVRNALTLVEQDRWSTPKGMVTVSLSAEKEVAHYGKHGQGARMGMMTMQDIGSIL